MKVFISWSGERSKLVAESLKSWIRQVLQAAETWISTDIEKGARWNEAVSKELEESKVGIICLDKGNLDSNWILFEAGALSKSNDAHVCTFLLDVKPSDVSPPLSQFQATQFKKNEINKLLKTINKRIQDAGERSLPTKDLDEVIDVFYSKLEEKLNKIIEIPIQSKQIIRTEKDLLDEILQTVRSLKTDIQSQNKGKNKTNKAFDKHYHGVYDIFQLNDLLVSELRQIAKEMDLEGYKRWNKQDLIYSILDAQTMHNGK